MKKILRRTLLVLSIVVLLVVLAWTAMFIKIKHETGAFTPVPTGRVVDNISVVKDDFSNVYIIKDSLGYVVVDSGNSADVVAGEMLKMLGIEPSEVFAVLLTHSDSDHTGALGLFDHAELYMAREEVGMTDGTTPKFLWFGNALPRTDYTLVDDRQVFRVGNLEVEGILVPGHTSGMMAWLVDGKYLFTGDAVSLVDGRIVEVPAFFDMDHKQAVRSHEIIRNIPSARYIFTGHWGWGDYKTAVRL